MYLAIECKKHPSDQQLCERVQKGLKLTRNLDNGEDPLTQF